MILDYREASLVKPAEIVRVLEKIQGSDRITGGGEGGSGSL